MKADLLSLLSPAGQFKPKGSGEWAGPCLLCGGVDRCCAWPERGRWWCRQCGKGGDAVDLLRLRDGLDYKSACAALGIAPAPKGGKPSSPAKRQRAVSGVRHKGDTGATKRKCSPLLPPAAWMEQAAAFLASCRTDAALSCQAAQDVLYGRGFTPEGVRALGIGFNPVTRWVPRSSWGLEGDKNLCLPAGIVLPVWRKAGLAALEVRRFGDDAAHFGKYAFISGGAAGLSYIHGGGNGRVWLVVEGALDGFLALQEADAYVAGFIACAGISKGLSADALAFLGEQSAVAIVPDGDGPGAVGCARLQAQLPGAVVVDVPAEKDLSAMHASGIPIALWAETFLAGLQAQADTGLSFCRADDFPTLPAVTPCAWPALRELTERHHATPFMVTGDDALLLEFAAGVFRGEKQAAVRFAEEHLAALANDLLLPAVPSGVRIATRAEIAKAGPFFEPETALESTKRKKAALHIGRMKNAA